MKECGMSDDSKTNETLSRGSLAELKKDCPDFIINVLPDELLSQSKCTCNKLTKKDRKKLIVIENRISELNKVIDDASQNGVISNINALAQEAIDVKNQTSNIFISLAKKCKDGL